MWAGGSLWFGKYKMGCKKMRFVQDGAARGLVNAAALHADQAVLDHIIQADAVAAADLVQLGDDG